MSKKLFWFIGIFALVIIGIIVLNDVQQKSVVIEYERQPYLGEESATVKIVEFGDYKCSHCKDFNDSIFPIINEELVKAGKAKFYFMNFPFISPDSTATAQFAETIYQELGNDIFWDFHHLLFANQIAESGKMNLFTDEFLKGILAEVASPEQTEQVMHAYLEEKGKAALKKDLSAAKGLGIQSTPTIYVDGKLFDGRSTDDLIKMVEEASTSGE